MRPQPDMPRRPSRRERKADRGSRFAGRGRSILGFVLLGTLVLLFSLRGIASFYTDFLWFRSIELTSVWRTVLSAQVSLTLIGTAAFFVLCWGNLAIAERLAPPFRPSSGEDDPIERYHQFVGRRAGVVRLVLAAFLAVVVGLSLGSSWNQWILFTNRVDFGERDATFNTDIGFYVFQLPFLAAAAAWLFSALILVLIVTLMAHLLNGGIRFHSNLDRVTPQVKAHVSVLLGALTLVQAGRYWLDRYQLTFSTRGTVDGATYTDVNVQLRVIYLLIAISLFAFALFIANIWRRGWVLPAMAVGLWLFVVVLAGALVPAFVQRFRVEPSESSMEAQYIENNIAATRAAYGVEDVERNVFDFSTELDVETIIDNVDVVANIRLWDPDVMRESYEAQQQIRQYYEINNVDVDRYMLDGELTQVMIGPRNLDRAGVPQASWEATHLAYTHGHGVVAAKANTKTTAGGPELLAQDIPLQTSGGLPEVDPDRTGIYFGEDKAGYVIVDTDRAEIDFQDDENNTQITTYDGADGITIGGGPGGFVNRAAFALRFGDINPLISGNIRPESRVIVERDVRARAEALAPFLAYDNDPYVVLIDGGIKYVMDAYTTTRNYPNAQRADTGGLQDDSGLRGRSFNYARNSVKVVVDAYDGTTDFFVVDDEDPLIRAYTSAFPDLFSSLDEAPEGLENHFRYPEDLFTVQTQMFARYHEGNPDTFYNGNNAWAVPREPGEVSLNATTAAVGPDGQALTDEDRFIPQYLLSRLPGEDRERFILMRPFVPSGGGDTQQRLLTSFMVANSDPDRYGELQAFIAPSNNLPDGPTLVADQMDSAPPVRELQTLLCSQGTTCRLRNMVVVPIGDSLLYVRSLFAQGDETGVPRLERVIVSYQSPNGNQIRVDSNLRGALVQLFGENVPDQVESTDVAGTGAVVDLDEEPEADPDGPGDTTTTTEPEAAEPDDGIPPTQIEQEDQLIADIVAAFDEADVAARDGDQVTYAEKVAEARGLAAELDQLRSEVPTAGTGGGGGADDDPPAATEPDTTTTTSAGA
ncbi:UPF0182 family protein [soil metagenome]